MVRKESIVVAPQKGGIKVHKQLKPEDYTLKRTNRYEITNRITRQTYQASAFSADEACRKLGWTIGVCFVREIEPWGYLTPKDKTTF